MSQMGPAVLMGVALTNLPGIIVVKLCIRAYPGKFRNLEISCKSPNHEHKNGNFGNSMKISKLKKNKI